MRLMAEAKWQVSGPKRVFAAASSAFALGYFIFGSFPEEVRRLGHRRLTLFAANLDEKAPAQIRQLQVVTATQEGPESVQTQKPGGQGVVQARLMMVRLRARRR